jgi:uncharacterized cupin superfamily protein
MLPVITPSTLPSKESIHGDKFQAVMTRLAPHMGLKQLGCTYMMVESGKTSFPFHHHENSDEMFVILEGEGVYRYGDERIPFKAGDILGAPHGVYGKAHQILNTGASVLKNLSISTMPDYDICTYPDSGKVGIFAGERQLGGGLTSMPFTYMGLLKDNKDYWEGE